MPTPACPSVFGSCLQLEGDLCSYEPIRRDSGHHHHPASLPYKALSGRRCSCTIAANPCSLRVERRLMRTNLILICHRCELVDLTCVAVSDDDAEAVMKSRKSKKKKKKETRKAGEEASGYVSADKMDDEPETSIETPGLFSC